MIRLGKLSKSNGEWAHVLPVLHWHGEKDLATTKPTEPPVLCIGSDELVNICSKVDFSFAESISHGTSGVYKISTNNEADGVEAIVWKPENEEYESTNGYGWMNEFAAFLIDKGFAGVPDTGIAYVMYDESECMLGAVQRFVANSEDAEDYGHGVFATDDIHRIGILDIRILNCDRHSGNMMRNKTTGALTPIDHGCAFPAVNDLEKVSYEWLSYPQAKQPFSPETLEFIENLDVEADMNILRGLDFEVPQLLSVWAATRLLQVAAKQGKTLFEIGSMIQRTGDRSEPSLFEQCLFKAGRMPGKITQNFIKIIECILAACDE